MSDLDIETDLLTNILIEDAQLQRKENFDRDHFGIFSLSYSLFLNLHAINWAVIVSQTLINVTFLPHQATALQRFQYNKMATSSFLVLVHFCLKCI
jgi:hypothetical protein